MAAKIIVQLSKRRGVDRYTPYNSRSAPGRSTRGKPQALFTIDAEARSTLHSVVSSDVAADGWRFVIPSITPGESSALVVLQDWEAQVAKLNY